MRVTKKLKSDLEIIDSLQKITGYKLTKNTIEKSPRMILLQKISNNNDANFPIKVQLLKTKNPNQNPNNNLINMNLTSLNSSNQKISFEKKDISFNKNQRYNKYSISSFLSQSPIKKESNSNIITQHQMLNTLSKNYAL